MWMRSRIFFVTLVALWWVRCGTLAAQRGLWPDDCNNVCSESGSCTDTCYASEVDFDNDNRVSCYTFGVYGLPCCGDGECTSGEDASTCFSDCHCGDGICNAGETGATCSQDCSAGGGSEGKCGNGTCDEGETCESCTGDCHTEADCGYCGDGSCAGDEDGGAGSLNTGHCDQIAHTWCTYCPDDCGACDPQYCLENGGLICDDRTGQCTSCRIDDDCAGAGDYYCNDGTGKCTESDYCVLTSYCQSQFGPSWFCNGDGVCRPSV